MFLKLIVRFQTRITWLLSIYLPTLPASILPSKNILQQRNRITMLVHNLQLKTKKKAKRSVSIPKNKRTRNKKRIKIKTSKINRRIKIKKKRRVAIRIKNQRRRKRIEEWTTVEIEVISAQTSLPGKETDQGSLVVAKRQDLSTQRETSALNSQKRRPYPKRSRRAKTGMKIN